MKYTCPEDNLWQNLKQNLIAPLLCIHGRITISEENPSLRPASSKPGTHMLPSTASPSSLTSQMPRHILLHRRHSLRISRTFRPHRRRVASRRSPGTSKGRRVFSRLARRLIMKTIVLGRSASGRKEARSRAVGRRTITTRGVAGSTRAPFRRCVTAGALVASGEGWFGVGPTAGSERVSAFGGRDIASLLWGLRIWSRGGRGVCGWGCGWRLGWAASCKLGVFLRLSLPPCGLAACKSETWRT